MKYIRLTNSSIRAICDDDAYEMLCEYTWSVCIRNGIPQSVQAWVNGEMVKMHQLVLAVQEEFVVDHKDHNIFDNRFSNLRKASYSQNNANRRKQKGTSSQYKGVTRDKESSKWKAQIQVDGKNISLGRFGSEIVAAREYNRAAVKHFGEFAKLNEFGDPLVGSEKEGNENV